MTRPAGPVHCHYGGTFDPVHNGHLAIARAVRDQLQVDVHMVPAADPPHRPPPGADAAQREHMLALAIAGQHGLLLDRRELLRDGPSFTVDSLRSLRLELGPDRPLVLVVGADSLLTLPQWHQWRQIPALAHVVVAARAGSPLEGALPAALAAAFPYGWSAGGALARHPAGRLYRLRHELLPEAASDVRALVASGQPWRHLVPAAVADFIGQQRLYTGR